jgi:hypothetical protein
MPHKGREVVVELEDSYLLPVDTTILIQDFDNEHTYRVISSEVGRVVARPTSALAPPYTQRRAVNIGVLAE